MSLSIMYALAPCLGDRPFKAACACMMFEAHSLTGKKICCATLFLSIEFRVVLCDKSYHTKWPFSKSAHGIAIILLRRKKVHTPSYFTEDLRLSLIIVSTGTVSEAVLDHKVRQAMSFKQCTMNNVHQKTSIKECLTDKVRQTTADAMLHHVPDKVSQGLTCGGTLPQQSTFPGASARIAHCEHTSDIPCIIIRN